MTKRLRFAVVLSGCGVFDGAEIQESVLTLLAISRRGGDVQCFAPDIPQHHVIDHYRNQPSPGETRNVLTESARIARGKIRPLSEYSTDESDILIIPGGFGAAKNLCSFAFDGASCSVNRDVEKALRAAHAARHPIGVWCIAPVVVARVLGNVTVTVGADATVEEALEAMGAGHRPASARDAILDRENRIVSTPCYMAPAPLSDIADGIQKAVDELAAMVGT
ncbi:isoprenoid biosynthesis glyoxalase ElbB [Phaeovibrio sulfidiphilus]|uniref:Isoprenoid biosynthesis glyoxalase ElbB n=1 Tax=Phaeovibrio sulfidiphilus TaxID=1220600 RepID=A0A8J6YMP5_9PROT|nr:isoprenoid biosynthesis glyoxalase ElbB [Phaeovibrio sulfidiphilus]MBE1237420.1 isoprenoid biosynthesis glyoxalase ElbB [Phaeovibrio sulfidiphilus]